MLEEKEILNILNSHIENSEAYLGDKIQRFQDNYKIYFGDKEYYKSLMPNLFKLEPHFVSQEIKDVVEWTMPSLMRIFFGSEDVIEIKGRTPEDDRPAKLMSALINWQLQRLNNGFIEFYKWFKAALITGGYMKVWWERKYVEKEEQAVLNQEEIENLKDQGYEIVSKKEIGDSGYFEVRYRWKEIDKDYPKFKHLRIDEVLVSPLSDKIEDNPFVAHVYQLSTSELKQREAEGYFENVDEAIRSNDRSEYTLLNKIWEGNGWAPVNYEVADKSQERHTVYECYVDIDLDQDGVAEKWIIWVVNGVIVRKEPNEYGRPPLFYLAPILLPHDFYGMGLAELLEDIQFLKTAFMKLAIVNSKYQIEPKYLVNPAYVNMEDIQNHRQFIRVNNQAGDPRQYIVPVPSQPLSGAFFSMLEYLFIERENRTGITRYNQGVGISRNSINRTATAVSLMVQQSAQRIELIARIFAETGVREMIDFLVYLNNKFLSSAVQIRLLNEAIEIRPDDLKGKFDLRIFIGSTAAEKELKATVLKELIANFVPMLVQMGLTDTVRIREMFADLLKLLGFTNPDRYLLTEEEIVAIIQQQLMNQGGQENGNPGSVQG